MLNQVSLFTENNQGGLSKITAILAKADINIYTMLANDSAEFGIVRLIVNNAALAIEALKAEGYQCRLDKVIGIMMTDTPGCLDGILKAVREANIDISYLYISYDRDTARPVVVMKTNESETAAFLMGKGYELVDNF